MTRIIVELVHPVRQLADYNIVNGVIPRKGECIIISGRKRSVVAVTHRLAGDLETEDQSLNYVIVGVV